MPHVRFEPQAQTEGGEALPVGPLVMSDAIPRPLNPVDPEAVRGRDLSGARWYALWTRSHCERLVHDQLIAKGFEAFLPTIDVWSRRGGVRHRIPGPMFPGYLFLRNAVDKASYIEVQKTRGLVRVLGERWDRLAPIPDKEIDAVQAVLQARVPVFPHAYLREGQRVRITRGPLTDVEGVLVRQNPKTGLLVLSVQLLRQSVAVEVDCTWAVPA